MFEGSKRLLEIADSISEIKSICKCGFKATMNAKIVNGKVVTSGTEIDIGGDEGGSWGEWSSLTQISSSGVNAFASKQVEYGQLLEYVVSLETITIKIGTEQKVFTANIAKGYAEGSA